MSFPATPLRVEALESRDLPATFGTPWPDGQHLTLSFAPTAPRSAGPRRTCRRLPRRSTRTRGLAVLRRSRRGRSSRTSTSDSWAIRSRVRDRRGGAGRFAVRRRPHRRPGVSRDVLAITAPYNLYDNFSGDVVLNTAAGLARAATTSTPALLQEAGHRWASATARTPRRRCTSTTSARGPGCPRATSRRSARSTAPPAGQVRGVGRQRHARDRNALPGAHRSGHRRPHDRG